MPNGKRQRNEEDLELIKMVFRWFYRWPCNFNQVALGHDLYIFPSGTNIYHRFSAFPSAAASLS